MESWKVCPTCQNDATEFMMRDLTTGRGLTLHCCVCGRFRIASKLETIYYDKKEKARDCCIRFGNRPVSVREGTETVRRGIISTCASIK